MRAISLRTKFILLCLASIALVGFVLAAITTLTVSALKEQIIGDAVALARGHGQELSHQIEKMLVDRDIPTPALLDGKDLDLLKHFLANREDEVIVSARFYDPKSDSTLEIYGELPAQIPQTALRLLTVPIQQEGEDVGELRLGVSERLALQRVQLSGGKLTAYSAALTGALFILMVLTFILLWKIFQRYLELTRENEQQERMAYIGTLAGGLAHEIRNPLNSININLDIIREEVEDPREDSYRRTHEVIRLLQTEIGQLNTTLNNFLAYAMPKKPAFEPCDLCAVVGETITLIEPHFKRLDAGIDARMPRSLIITADAARLRQVFWNVLLNALEAMEEKSEKRLTVEVEPQAPRIRILISDTGAGIPAEDWEKVFEVFHSKRSGGSGFGLAIARRIICDHQGDIRIVSSSAEGTTIEISMPMDVGAVSAAESN